MVAPKNIPKETGKREREILKLVKANGLKAHSRTKSEKRFQPCGERSGSRDRQIGRKERARFFPDPFKCAKGLLEEKKNGKLEATVWEDHIKSQLGNQDKNTPLACTCASRGRARISVRHHTNQMG